MIEWWRHGEIDDPRRQTERVKGQAHGVDGRLQQLRRDAGIEPGDRMVGQHDVPAPVDREGRIRLVCLEDLPDRAVRRCQLRKRAFLERRREPRRQQQGIAFPQRDVEILGKPHHHLPARLRPPGLEVARMPGRAVCRGRKIHLGHAAALPPAPQQHTKRLGLGGRCLLVHRLVDSVHVENFHKVGSRPS
jgi:hypothetical protein